MPNRWIRESARTSKNLSEVADFSERLFWRLITTADDYGRFLACASIVKAICFPLMDGMKVTKVERSLKELVDRDLIVLYQAGDRHYGVFLKWIEHQGEPRSKKSKYPDPPPSLCVQTQTTANNCSQVFTVVSSKQHTRSAPDTEPETVSLSDSERAGTRSKLNGHGSNFKTFWAAYPKKRNKGQAERAWLKLQPDDFLFGRILGKIEVAKQSADWNKQDGRFVPYPASWLDAKGWEDEYSVHPQRTGGLQL